MAAPTVARSLAANQDVVLSALEQLGVVEMVARDRPPSEGIGEAVLRLLGDPRRRRGMAAAARSLVDGAGSARAAGVIATVATRQFALRDVQPGDESQVLQWANDPHARRHAFRPDPIDAQSHARWFRQRLERRDSCRMFMAETKAGLALGLVRFEQQADHWEISYSLDPAFRGWGLGRPLLALALARLAAVVPGGSAVGFVKLDNVASLRTFRGLGFLETPAQREGIECRAFSLTLSTASG
jgi:RimJ/RimL family protein N-acetyltransferase